MKNILTRLLPVILCMAIVLSCAGITAVAETTSTYDGYVAYVKEATGNDTTGALGDSTKPFKTFGAALTALETKFAESDTDTDHGTIVILDQTTKATGNIVVNTGDILVTSIDPLGQATAENARLVRSGSTGVSAKAGASITFDNIEYYSTNTVFTRLCAAGKVTYGPGYVTNGQNSSEAGNKASLTGEASYNSTVAAEVGVDITINNACELSSAFMSLDGGTIPSLKYYFGPNLTGSYGVGTSSNTLTITGPSFITIKNNPSLSLAKQGTIDYAGGLMYLNVDSATTYAPTAGNNIYNIKVTTGDYAGQVDADIKSLGVVTLTLPAGVAAYNGADALVANRTSDTAKFDVTLAAGTTGISFGPAVTYVGDDIAYVNSASTTSGALNDPTNPYKTVMNAAAALAADGETLEGNPGGTIVVVSEKTTFGANDATSYVFTGGDFTITSIDPSGRVNARGSLAHGGSAQIIAEYGASLTLENIDWHNTHASTTLASGFVGNVTLGNGFNDNAATNYHNRINFIVNDATEALITRETNPISVKMTLDYSGALSPMACISRVDAVFPGAELYFGGNLSGTFYLGTDAGSGKYLNVTAPVFATIENQDGGFSLYDGSNPSYKGLTKYAENGGLQVIIKNSSNTTTLKTPSTVSTWVNEATQKYVVRATTSAGEDVTHAELGYVNVTVPVGETVVLNGEDVYFNNTNNTVTQKIKLTKSGDTENVITFAANPLEGAEHIAYVREGSGGGAIGIPNKAFDNVAAALAALEAVLDADDTGYIVVLSKTSTVWGKGATISKNIVITSVDPAGYATADEDACLYRNGSLQMTVVDGASLTFENITWLNGYNAGNTALMLGATGNVTYGEGFRVDSVRATSEEYNNKNTRLTGYQEAAAIGKPINIKADFAGNLIYSAISSVNSTATYTVAEPINLYFGENISGSFALPLEGRTSGTLNFEAPVIVTVDSSNLEIYKGTTTEKDADGNNTFVGNFNGGVQTLFRGGFENIYKMSYGVFTAEGGEYVIRSNANDITGAAVEHNGIGYVDITVPENTAAIVANGEDSAVYFKSKTKFALTAGETTIKFVSLGNDVLYTAGAQIRLDETAALSGLRFVCEINEELRAALGQPKSTEDTGAGYGYVVIPTEMLTGTLDKSTANAKIVPAVYMFTSNAEGTPRYTVCITDIPVENYTRYYTTVPYITDADGNTWYGEAYESAVLEVAQAAVESETESDANKQAAQAIIDKVNA